VEDQVIFTNDTMKDIFYILELTIGVPQLEEYHPEGDVFNHLMQTYFWALRDTNDTDLILAALLHDVGKAAGLQGHDDIGSDMIRPYTSHKTTWLVSQHMRVWTLLKGEMRRPGKVKALANHPWFPELVLLARWDKMARNPRKKVTYDKNRIMAQLNRRGMENYKWQS
jgi:predicted HD phosphohydrolase